MASSIASCYSMASTHPSTPAAAFSGRPSLLLSQSRSQLPSPDRSFKVSCSVTKEKQKPTATSDPDEVTRKFGLEAGLWKIFTSKNETETETGEDGAKTKGNQAKELLARYGGAYLATSISLSAVSFGICYALINSGVDVAGLLQKVGIDTNETGERVGTFALAYAAHKAASPIRFPPTVALTPIVASWLGKKVTQDKDDTE